MKISVVDRLPTLEADQLGELPVTAVRPGNLLMPFETKWRGDERPTVAAAMVTACIRAGKWKPLTEDEFTAVLSQYAAFLANPKGCQQAFEQLVSDGELNLVEHLGVRYCIPTRALIRGVLKSPPFLQELPAVLRRRQPSA